MQMKTPKLGLEASKYNTKIIILAFVLLEILCEVNHNIYLATLYK